MRLMDIETKALIQFTDDNLPQYAILSHTWEDGEVTFQDLQMPHAQTMPGYTKIDYLCRQAAIDGLKYVWIDTCNIDKQSSTELSEAINSMYKWYQNAKVCYAYLVDVLHVENETFWDSSASTSQFCHSRWFTRGWTLQELLAPCSILFFGAGWRFLGDRGTLIKEILTVTNIPEHVLRCPQMIQCYSIAARMCWAAERVTTRIEDRAYSLLGIFDINMPLVYGEGTKALIRLQEELVKKSDDESIFVHSDAGIFATDPSFFRSAENVGPLLGKKNTRPYSMTNKGLQIDLLLLTRDIRPDEKLGILNCHSLADYSSYIAIPLGETGRPNVYSRLQVHDTKWVRVSAEEAEKAERCSIYIATEASTQNQSTFQIHSEDLRNVGFELRPPVFDSRIDQGKAMLVWRPDLHVMQMFSLMNTFIKFGLFLIHPQTSIAYCIYVRTCGLSQYPVEFGLAYYEPLLDTTLSTWMEAVERQIKDSGGVEKAHDIHQQQGPHFYPPVFSTAFVYPPNPKRPRDRINEVEFERQPQSNSTNRKTIVLGRVQATMHREEKLGEDIWVLDLSIVSRTAGQEPS